MAGLTMILFVLFAIPAGALQTDAERLFGSAMAAQQRGDLSTAIGDYRKLLQASPKLLDARVDLGAALAQTGQFDEA